MNTITLSFVATRRTRSLIAEIESSAVNALARETDLPITTAAELRRLFLLERVANATLCVEVDGSAHHTRSGDPGAPDSDAPGVFDAVEEDDDLTVGEEIDGDAPEAAGKGTKQYTYLGDAITAAVQAGLVVPTSGAFRRSRHNLQMWRYARLTAVGRELADKYVAHEARQYTARGLPDLEATVKTNLRTGTLKVEACRGVR